jgi:cytochrome c2
MRLGFVIILLPLVAAGCDGDTRQNAISMTGGGNPDKGKQKFLQYGCAACHKVSGVSEASAVVGPALDQVAGRAYIGGVLKNTPDNMIQWIQDPPRFSPRTAMPNLHIGDEDAKDIASFLYTLK